MNLLLVFLYKVSWFMRSLCIFLLMVGVAIGVGKYSWKGEQQPVLLSLSPSSPEKLDENNDESEENEDDTYESDLRSPWTLLKTALPSCYYAPIQNVKRPTIVLILTGLGLDQDWTNYILSTLKGNMTLAFNAYSPYLKDQLQQAINQGFQTLIALPMESYDYPRVDSGPHTLLIGVNADENIAKTKAILEKIPENTGVIADHGSRFTLSINDLKPVLMEIHNQNRLFIDPRNTLYSQVPTVCKTLNIPYYAVDLTLSFLANLKQVDEFLKKIIQHAQENGMVIASAPATPLFIHSFLEWKETLDKDGINFARFNDLK